MVEDLNRYFSKGYIQMANMERFKITNHQGDTDQNHSDITLYMLEWLL